MSGYRYLPARGSSPQAHVFELPATRVAFDQASGIHHSHRPVPTGDVGHPGAPLKREMVVAERVRRRLLDAWAEVVARLSLIDRYDSHTRERRPGLGVNHPPELYRERHGLH